MKNSKISRQHLILREAQNHSDERLFYKSKQLKLAAPSFNYSQKSRGRPSHIFREDSNPGSSSNPMSKSIEADHLFKNSTKRRLFTSDKIFSRRNESQGGIRRVQTQNNKFRQKVISTKGIIPFP